MKKIALLMVCALLAALPACATEIDYSALGTDELVDLRNEIEEILADRIPSDSWTIYRGEYYVGDGPMPEGFYVGIADEGYYTIGPISNFNAVRLIVYENTELYESGEKCIDKVVYHDGPMIVHLKKGMILYIDCTGKLQPIAKPAYMP